MVTAIVLLLIVGAYATAGVAFAVYFARSGASRLDPAATDATIGARLLWMPAAAALWPLLLWRCLRTSQHERSLEGTS